MSCVQFKPTFLPHVGQEGEPLFVFVRPPQAAAQTQVTSLNLERLPSDAESRTMGWDQTPELWHFFTAETNEPVSCDYLKFRRVRVSSTDWLIRDNCPAESFKHLHHLRTRSMTWKITDLRHISYGLHLILLFYQPKKKHIFGSHGSCKTDGSPFFKDKSVCAGVDENAIFTVRDEDSLFRAKSGSGLLWDVGWTQTVLKTLAGL